MMEIFEHLKASKNIHDAKLNKLGKWGKFFAKSLVVILFIVFVLLVVIVISLFFPKEYQSKISFFINIIMYSTMFYVITFIPFIAIKQILLEKKEEKQKFNILYKLNNKKVKSNKFIIILILFVFLIFALLIYTNKYYYFIIPDTPNSFGDLSEYGNYIGGIFGTLLTALMLSATLLMINQQEQQIEISKKEFQQQQFENTLHTLLKELNICKLDNELTQFYLSLRLIYQQFEEYKKNHHIDDRDFILQKHNYIIKSNFDKHTLYRIFTDKRVQNSKYDDYTLFSNIKKIIEEYRLFENIIDINEFGYEQKKHIFDYPLLSYFGNYSIINYIFKEVKDSSESVKIKSYIENSIANYQLYAIKEEDPIFYLSLIMYDKDKIFSFPSILNNKLKNIEFSNIRNRNLFLFKYITYVLCDIRLYNKYPKTVECVIFKMIKFLEQQVNDSIYRSENIIQLICTVANHIRELNEQNKNKINITLTKILLDILKEKQYPISTTILLNEIITIHQGHEWNELKNTIKEFYDTLNENEKLIEMEYEKIQMYRNNKQNLIEYIDKNKEKLHIPMVKKWRIFRQSKL
ncbi:MAG: hypothetical protein J6M43_07590 [Neisseriaceae bacterium]|nr:hypothetical protein [Neisseriaceae bacterium]